MPIVDVQLIVSTGEQQGPTLTQELADTIGRALSAKHGRVWVRLSTLAAENYAENERSPVAHGLPVFVKVLHADLPPVEDLDSQARVLALVVANCTGRSPDLVHIEYSPPGRGRIAFGGNLVR